MTDIKLNSAFIRKAPGFTMIELLIIMAILSALISLVGPLTIDALEKSQAKTELLKFKNTLAKISMLAFSEGKKQCVDLNGRYLRLGCDKLNFSEEIKYQYLNFEPTTINYNRLGFASIDLLQFHYKEEFTSISLIRSYDNEK